MLIFPQMCQSKAGKSKKEEQQEKSCPYRWLHPWLEVTWSRDHEDQVRTVIPPTFTQTQTNGPIFDGFFFKNETHTHTMTPQTKTPKRKLSELPAALLTTCKGRHPGLLSDVSLNRATDSHTFSPARLITSRRRDAWTAREKKQQAIVTFGLIKAAN